MITRAAVTLSDLKISVQTLLKTVYNFLSDLPAQPLMLWPGSFLQTLSRYYKAT